MGGRVVMRAVRGIALDVAREVEEGHAEPRGGRSDLRAHAKARRVRARLVARERSIGRNGRRGDDQEAGRPTIRAAAALPFGQQNALPEPLDADPDRMGRRAEPGL